MTGSRERPQRRGVDGYVPIEDYAVLGDGRTAALVARDGRIDWWPVPALDSPPMFAAIVDPADGGYLSLHPADSSFTSSRRYLPDTNVLETTFHSGQRKVTVTDALTVGAAGPLPWGELVRRVDGVDGEVAMEWSVRPGTRFDTARPWTEATGGGGTIHLGDQHIGVVAVEAGVPHVEPRGVSGRFSTAPGSQSHLAITTADNEPLFIPQRCEFIHHLDRTVARWQEWSAGIRYDGAWSREVRRSALALKLLLHSPTGAIAAAATTSLPERIGGDKN